MRFNDAQAKWLRESAESMTEENPGIQVHFAQTEETGPVTTVRYDEDASVGAYLEQQQPPDPALLELRAQQVLQETVERWRAMGAQQPVMRDLGHREYGGRSVREWSISTPGT